ncbi:hypothetical protein BOC40_01560 [Burkholderia pseudomallei]|uniref:hypothetical protein n=1 Tax=Burkholderia pseudomallei TaxID=28450 RepID=UPI000A1A073B|nr:hypothetical protein [Burkholderia pseudomallei]ARK79259.1 hypothetical protein BOC40_01560 [Burkholderia pseudomallei]ARL47164.1 hypothetical protein BOC50_30365 [Burkholderia pseudomallei]
MEACNIQPSVEGPTYIVDDESSLSFAGLRDPRFLSVRMLAISTTAISVCIAAYAGWLRGDTALARLVWIALSVVAVFGLHLLPTHVCQAGTRLRILLMVIWAALLVFVTEGQVTFFHSEELNAADKRAMAVPVIIAPSLQQWLGRSPLAIARDRAAVSAKLAAVNVGRCPAGTCPTLQTRKAALSAELAALAVEADEAKRREAEEDRQQAQADKSQALRDARRANPVASTLASLLGTGESRLNSILVFIPTVVLDGLAVACWLLVGDKGRRAPKYVSVAGDVNHSVAKSRIVVATEVGLGAVTTEPVVATHDPDVVAAVGDAPTLSEDDATLGKIHEAVVTGRLNATQRAIRELLRCQQKEAARLNRLYAERFGSRTR